MSETGKADAAEFFSKPDRIRSHDSLRNRLLIGFALLIAMMLLLAPSFRNTLDPTPPQVINGVVDFADSRLKNRPARLAGEWAMTWLAGSGGPPPGLTFPIKLPGRWTGQSALGHPLPQFGTARYEIELRGLLPGTYLLHVPSVYAGSKVSIDGHVRSRHGIVGVSYKSTRIQVRSHNVSFEAHGRPVRVAIDIAAWRHRDNGLDEAPVLGTAGAMNEWAGLQWSSEQLFNVSLVMVALMGIAVFSFRPQEKAPLFLGLSCLGFLPPFAILGYDNLLLIQLPALAFEPMMAVQYLSMTAAVAFFLLAAYALFPGESPRRILLAVLAWIGLLSLRQLWYFSRGDTLGASQTQNPMLFSLLLALVYIMVIVARAAWRQREGAAIFLFGITLFVASVALNTATSRGWLGGDFVGFAFAPLGIAMLLYAQIVVMAERWALAVRIAEHINDDLRQLLDVNSAITSDLQLGSLLEKIVSVNSKILRADRSSLFLKVDHEQTLISMVAEGVGEKKIAFDAGHGIAGYAFATGQPLNIADAYADPRFNQQVDQATGYRTRSILTVPISAKDGRRLGVMQALNRIDGQSFGDDDASRMAAFGAQAAIAIDNARLFEEVVAARDFDESILSSMSAGVIALDHEWIITKLNQAAADTMGAPLALLQGLNARSLMERQNHWLIEEIASVYRERKSKFLLDVDLITAREESQAVNLSIVPLRIQDFGGVLLLIEDISETKRLQSTMRRFLSPSVVDTVLDRRDELMFGTACEASVLFADIRGFTSLAEKLTARETVETLNELFAELFEPIADNDGVLDKFIGDAIMAVFGAPLSMGRDAANAVATGLEMLRIVRRISSARLARGQSPIRLGIGIASGEVVAGTIGSPKRMDYTVIGDSVNLSARLQELTKSYGVDMLVDCATAAAVGPAHQVREIDRVIVRGRERPETVYEVATLLVAPEGGGLVHTAYAQGRRALAAKNWADAVAEFAEALRVDPHDQPSKMMLERSLMLQASPPDPDWDGVWRDPIEP